jgi:hypothetical protein
MRPQEKALADFDGKNSSSGNYEHITAFERNFS